MNRIFLLVFLALSAFQCKKDKLADLPECPNCNFTCLEPSDPDAWTNNCKSNWDCQFDLHPDSKLHYDFNQYLDEATIEPGSKQVFKFRAETEGSAIIADDEFTDFLFFEIPGDQESFSASDDELEGMNLRYQVLCYCSDVHLKKPASGCMQGQKIDETHWRVQANLVIEYEFGTQEVKLDAVFSE